MTICIRSAGLRAYLVADCSIGEETVNFQAGFYDPAFSFRKIRSGSCAAQRAADLRINYPLARTGPNNRPRKIDMIFDISTIPVEKAVCKSSPAVPSLYGQTLCGICTNNGLSLNSLIRKNISFENSDDFAQNAHPSLIDAVGDFFYSSFERKQNLCIIQGRQCQKAAPIGRSSTLYRKI
jgi:hypothetical protein